MLFLDPHLIIVMSPLLSGAGDGTLSTGLPATSLSGRTRSLFLARRAGAAPQQSQLLTVHLFLFCCVFLSILVLLHPRRRYALWPLPPHIPHALTPTIPFPYFSFALPPPIGTAFSAYVLPPFLCFFSVRRAETSPLRVSHHVPIRLDWR